MKLVQSSFGLRVLEIIFTTRTKPAYGRQGLTQDRGPGHSSDWVYRWGSEDFCYPMVFKEEFLNWSFFSTHMVLIFYGRQTDRHIFSTHVMLSFCDRQTYFWKWRQQETDKKTDKHTPRCHCHYHLHHHVSRELAALPPCPVNIFHHLGLFATDAAW